MKRLPVAILVLLSIAALFAAIRFVVLPIVGAKMVSRLEAELSALGRLKERFEAGDVVRASNGLRFVVPDGAQATAYVPDERQGGPSTENIEVTVPGKTWAVIVSTMSPRPTPSSLTATVAASGGVAVRGPGTDSGMLAIVDFGQDGRLLVMKSEAAREQAVAMSEGDVIALVHEVWDTLHVEGVDLP